MTVEAHRPRPRPSPRPRTRPAPPLRVLPGRGLGEARRDIDSPVRGRSTKAACPMVIGRRDVGLLVLTVFAFVSSFFSYYRFKAAGGGLDAICASLPASDGSELAAACAGFSNSAWQGLFGWLGALCSLGVAALLGCVAFRPGSVRSGGRVVVLGGLSLAMLFTAIAWIVIPDGEYRGQSISSGATGVATSHGPAFWCAFVADVIALVAAATSARSRRRT
jgi:hypothetical protein